MQKLITIYLDNQAYQDNRLFRNQAAKHGHIEEYLQTYLEQGWRIVSMSELGGSDGTHIRGWLAVVLEKEAAA